MCAIYSPYNIVILVTSKKVRKNFHLFARNKNFYQQIFLQNMVAKVLSAYGMSEYDDRV